MLLYFIGVNLDVFNKINPNYDFKEFYIQLNYTLKF